MGRPLRHDPIGGYHHVVNRGVDRQAIFRADVDRVEFGRLLGEGHRRFGVWLHAYCLMNNHFHLLVECPDGGLSEMMQLVGSSYVRHFNERVGRDGPLFEARFYAKPVTDDGQLTAAVQYIHRNPLAFLTDGQLETYRWSSLRAYLGYRSPPNWLRIDVAQGVGDPTAVAASPWASATATMTAGRWAQLIGLMVDAHLRTGTKQGAERTVAVLLLDHVDDVAGNQLRELLDFPTVGAERTARSKARRREREHPSLAQVTTEVLAAAA